MGPDFSSSPQFDAEGGGGSWRPVRSRSPVSIQPEASPSRRFQDRSSSASSSQDELQHVQTSIEEPRQTPDTTDFGAPQRTDPPNDQDEEGI